MPEGTTLYSPRIFRRRDRRANGTIVNYRNKTPLHRLPVFRVLRAQSLVMLLAALIGTLLFDWLSGYSMLLGGLIALLANVYFAFKAFRYFGARSAQAIVQSFWAGEMGKLILTAALFALVFVAVKPLQPLALFTGYLLVLGTGASALLLLKNNPKH